MDMSGEERAIGAAVHLGSEFTTSECHAHEQGATMTENRMEAKPRAGEHGRFCGNATAPLVKTPWCDQWMCGDTAVFSFRGGGRCQVEHERFSLCYAHDEDTHGGPWQSCQKCREFWSPRDDQR